MTPKDKAEELVDKFMNIRNIKLSDYSIIYLPTAKQCALIVVDEIDLLIQNSTPKDDPYGNLFALEYWQEVKQEIEKL